MEPKYRYNDRRITSGFEMLFSFGWGIVRASCECGGLFAWAKPLESGSWYYKGHTTQGCICHNDPWNLYDKHYGESGNIKGKEVDIKV